MLSEEERVILLQVIEAFGWTAFASTALIFTLYGLDKRSLQYPNKIFWLATISTIVSAFFVPFGTISLEPGTYDTLTPQCNAQAFIGHYGFMSWAISVALSSVWLYLLLKNSKFLIRAEDEILTWYCTACYILPLLPTIIALIADVYGPLGVWCFIDSQYGYGWILGLFYIPITACCIVASVFLILSVLLLLQRVKAKINNESRHFEYNDEQWYHLQIRLVVSLTLTVLITLGLMIYAFVTLAAINLGEPITRTFGESITLVVFIFLLYLVLVVSLLSTKMPFRFIKQRRSNRSDEHK
jgi:cbb3-type cytochrome oxidase subunit 3